MIENRLFDAFESRWYVLFVRSNQEKKISSGLGFRGVEHFLPCRQAVHQWADRRVKLNIPLFPGYVFVRLPYVDRMKALTVRNVVSLVGTKTSPSVVSQDEIDWIKRGIEHGNAQPHEPLKIGERVAITSGVMAGLEGILLRSTNGARVVVSLDCISRAFVVEVDAALVRTFSNTAEYEPRNRQWAARPGAVY